MSLSWWQAALFVTHETWWRQKSPAFREWQRRWTGQPDWEVSQRGVSAPSELVKTIVPLCLSRFCLSAWRGLILARACSRWFINMGPGKTRGPGGERNFHMHARLTNGRKHMIILHHNNAHKLQNYKRHKQGGSHHGKTPKLTASEGTIY